MAAARKTAKRAAKPADAQVTAANAAEDFTAAAQEQFETVMQSFTGNMEEMREKAEEITGAMRERFEKTQKHVADVNAGVMEAARSEISGAVQLTNDLAQAKSFADALQIQQNYWTSLLETRMERAREITEASVDAARETMTPAETSFSAFFDPKTYEKFFPFAPKA